MKTKLWQAAVLAVVATLFTGCFAAFSGPDGGIVAAGAGPRRAGVAVDPPGPLGLALGSFAPRRTVYVEREPVYVQRRPYYVEPDVVYVPRPSRRVIYRDETAYWNRPDYRRGRDGYVIVR